MGTIILALEVLVAWGIWIWSLRVEGKSFDDNIDADAIRSQGQSEDENTELAEWDPNAPAGDLDEHYAEYYAGRNYPSRPQYPQQNYPQQGYQGYQGYQGQRGGPPSGGYPPQGQQGNDGW